MLLQTLDTDRGEFICPVCRQMANALLPVPPDAQDLPPALVHCNLEDKAATIERLLGEETFHMVSFASTEPRPNLNCLCGAGVVRA